MIVNGAMKDDILHLRVLMFSLARPQMKLTTAIPLIGLTLFIHCVIKAWHSRIPSAHFHRTSKFFEQIHDKFSHIDSMTMIKSAAFDCTYPYYSVPKKASHSKSPCIHPTFKGPIQPHWDWCTFSLKTLFIIFVRENHASISSHLRWHFYLT